MDCLFVFCFCLFVPLFVCSLVWLIAMVPRHNPTFSSAIKTARFVCLFDYLFDCLFEFVCLFVCLFVCSSVLSVFSFCDTVSPSLQLIGQTNKQTQRVCLFVSLFVCQSNKQTRKQTLSILINYITVQTHTGKPETNNIKTISNQTHQALNHIHSLKRMYYTQKHKQSDNPSNKQTNNQTNNPSNRHPHTSECTTPL